MFSSLSTGFRGLLLVSAFVALVSGCGPDYKARAIVKGTVTIGGKNLTAGTVVFHGKDNMTGSGAIQQDGTYVCSDAPLGEVKVSVSVPKPPTGGLGHMKGAPLGPVPPGEAPPEPEKRANPVPIPNRYSDPDLSGLTYKVERGTSIFDIPLKP